MEFDTYTGIDWSGAKIPSGGIQIAQCGKGHSCPELVFPLGTGKRHWTRKAVLDWIFSRVSKGERILSGIDFAFAYPHCDMGAYFPGREGSPENPSALWNRVDQICHGAKDFYGMPFFGPRNAPFREYLCYNDYTGANFDGRRLRITEQVCRKLGASPNCVFNCVGPGAVGIGSIAGMRFLRHLTAKLNGRLAVWPFRQPEKTESVVVEIFPRLFYVCTDQDPRKWTERTVMNRVLAQFGSAPLPEAFVPTRDDEMDAIISAAALRHFAAIGDAWRPTRMVPRAVAYEGWIFGAF